MAVASEMATAPPLRLKSCFTFCITGSSSKIHYSNFKLRYRLAPIGTSASTTARADSKKRQNQASSDVDGDFFVDNTCIDYVCRWMAPETFRRSDGKSAVFKLPTCDEHRRKALQVFSPKGF